MRKSQKVVSRRSRSLPGAWCVAASPLILSLAGLLCLLATSPSLAHPLLMNFVQHRVQLTVGPTNTDIEIDLDFNELRSMIERRRMDEDHDGTITAVELSRYERGMDDALADSVELLVDGKAVEVMPLYAPKVDLLGVTDVAPCRHVMRLFYFARTPACLAAGSELVVRDRLWLNAPAICALTATGEDGIQVAAMASDPFSDPTTDPQPRIVKARCRAVPPRQEPAMTTVLKPPALPSEQAARPGATDSADASVFWLGADSLGIWLLLAATVGAGLANVIWRRA